MTLARILSVRLYGQLATVSDPYELPPDQLDRAFGEPASAIVLTAEGEGD